MNIDLTQEEINFLMALLSFSKYNVFNENEFELQYSINLMEKLHKQMMDNI